MGGFNFADSYKASGLNLGPEIIGLRDKPFEKLRKKIDAQTAVNLARLYFGLPVPGGTDWFRDPFFDADPSFSMVDNEREAAVLAACLLSAAIFDREAAAALAILTSSAGGNRQPLVLPELIEEAREALIEIAKNERHHQMIDPKTIKLPAKTNIHEEVDALVAAPDWNKAAELFKKLSDVSVKGAKNPVLQMQGVLLPLVSKVVDLQEEVAILWWHIGGWSRVLEAPFVGLEPGLAAAMVGLDLADLSQTVAGPAAVSAIIQRTIFAGRGGHVEKASINNAVDALPPEAYEKLELGDELKNLSDVCPVLTGFLKAHEIGESPAWINAFNKAAHFDPSIDFELLDLAMQVYRERSLLSAVS